MFSNVTGVCVKQRFLSWRLLVLYFLYKCSSKRERERERGREREVLTLKEAIAPMERILSFYRVFLLRQNIFDSYPSSLCIHYKIHV